MDLWMFYIGGSAGRSNIELHDVQFVAAQNPQDAWPALREAWYGDPDSLHLDGYARIQWVNGYRVSLADTPAQGEERLFFVNVGGYRPHTLAELHEFDLIVAKTAEEASAKALASLLGGAGQLHEDDLKAIDDCLLLDRVGGFHIHLTATDGERHFAPEWQGYQPINL